MMKLTDSYIKEKIDNNYKINIQLPNSKQQVINSDNIDSIEKEIDNLEKLLLSMEEDFTVIETLYNK